MPTDPSDLEITSQPMFEIKIGLIGDVHVDRTSVYHSLLREKFGEISTKMKQLKSSSIHEVAISSPAQWELVRNEDDEPPSKPKYPEIKDEVCASEKVTTRRLEVELEEPLFEMRKDTQLVLVDIPGVDLSDTNYKKYLETHWNTFDCIIFVADWQQGVENQASLLELVKKNKEFQRNVPVVVVSRKVQDDTRDQIKFLSQVRQLVEKIFGVSDLDENLDAILDSFDMLPKGEDLETSTLEEEEDTHEVQKSSLVVIPETGCDDDTLLKVLSFLVGGIDNQKRIIEDQIQSLLTAVTFDPNFVKKLEMLHKFLVLLSGDDEACKIDVRPAFWQLCTALEQSFFDCPNCSKATDVFTRIVDECTEYKRFATEQGWETEATRVVAAARSSCCRFLASMNWHFGFVLDLNLMYNKLKEVSPDAIDADTKKALNETFHRLIGDLWHQTIAVAVTLPDTLKFLSALVDEIIQYDKFVKEAGMDYVRSYIEGTFGFFLRFHLQGLCQKAADGLFYYSYVDPSTPKNSFASLTPIDWNRVFRSILLLRYDRRFCETFGNEIVWMEYLIDQANAAAVPDVTGHAGLKPVAHNQKQLFMKLSPKGSQLVPSNGFNLSQTVIEIPASFSDPNHFAHIAWRYCEFMKGKDV